MKMKLQGARLNNCETTKEIREVSRRHLQKNLGGLLDVDAQQGVTAEPQKAWKFVAPQHQWPQASSLAPVPALSSTCSQKKVLGGPLGPFTMAIRLPRHGSGVGPSEVAACLGRLGVFVVNYRDFCIILLRHAMSQVFANTPDNFSGLIATSLCNY